VQELKNIKRIAHLKNLGRTRTIAIANLEEGLKVNPDFLEIAEITDSHIYRDGELLNKSVDYVAGICGDREAKNEVDIKEDVYCLVYFNGIIQKNGVWEHGGGIIHSNSLRNIVDYKPLK